MILVLTRCGLNLPPILSMNDLKERTVLLSEAFHLSMKDLKERTVVNDPGVD